MTPILLSRILIGAIALLIVGVGVSFYFLSQALNATALATDHAKIDAELSQLNVERLKRLEVDLKSKHEVVERARSIISANTTYQYQDQIVNDLNTYAAKAGVRILGFDFNTKTATPSTQSSGAGGVASQPKTSTSGAVSGTDKLKATVTLQGPVEFEKILRFLKAIEQNLTKMQVNSVNITKDDKLPNLVNAPSIGLEIYVKK